MKPKTNALGGAEPGSVEAASNEELMQRYAAGDFAAFEALYTRNKGGLYRYLLRQLHDSSLVEDLFQEVWGKVISAAPSYQSTANFTTWLYTIARNKVIDHVRHIRVVNKVISSPKIDDISSSLNGLSGDSLGHELEQTEQSHAGQNQRGLPEQHLEQAFQAAAIEHCMNKLAQHHLDSFLLKEESGLPASQIAQILNTSLEATKSRLRSAYKHLRECLARRLDESGEQQAQKTKGRIGNE